MSTPLTLGLPCVSRTPAWSVRIIGRPDSLQTVFVEPVQAAGGDVPTAVVDGQRVPAVGELDQVVDCVRVAVLLERGFGDGFRDGMVLAAHDEQQRAAVVDGRVDLGG